MLDLLQGDEMMETEGAVAEGGEGTVPNSPTESSTLISVLDRKTIFRLAENRMLMIIKTVMGGRKINEQETEKLLEEVEFVYDFFSVFVINREKDLSLKNDLVKKLESWTTELHAPKNTYGTP